MHGVDGVGKKRSDCGQAVTGGLTVRKRGEGGGWHDSVAEMG